MNCSLKLLVFCQIGSHAAVFMLLVTKDLYWLVLKIFYQVTVPVCMRTLEQTNVKDTGL